MDGDVVARAHIVARAARALLARACVEPKTRCLPELFDAIVERGGLNVRSGETVLHQGVERVVLLAELGEACARFVPLFSAAGDLGRALQWLEIRQGRGGTSKEDAAPACSAVRVLAFHSLAILERALVDETEFPCLILEVLPHQARCVLEPTWKQYVGGADFAAALRDAEETFGADVLTAEQAAKKLADAAMRELDEEETSRRAAAEAAEALAAASRAANRQRPAPDLPPPKSVKSAKGALAIAMRALSVAETCAAMARPSHKAEALATARAKRSAANRAAQELALARQAAATTRQP